MELKLRKGGVNMSEFPTFNRTAYGIEMVYRVLPKMPFARF